MTWEIAILKSIRHLGGHGYPDDVYKTVGLFKELTPQHRRATVYGGRPAYYHQVRSHLTNLCQSGDLINNSDAQYSLTPKGAARIA
jgi:hypothetical protein